MNNLYRFEICSIRYCKGTLKNIWYDRSQIKGCKRINYRIFYWLWILFAFNNNYYLIVEINIDKEIFLWLLLPLLCNRQLWVISLVLRCNYRLHGVEKYQFFNIKNTGVLLFALQCSSVNLLVIFLLGYKKTKFSKFHFFYMKD